MRALRPHVHTSPAHSLFLQTRLKPTLIISLASIYRSSISNLSSVYSSDDDRGVNNPFVCARRDRVDPLGAAISRFHVAASSARSDEAGNGSFDVRGGEELEE